MVPVHHELVEYEVGEDISCSAYRLPFSTGYLSMLLVNEAVYLDLSIVSQFKVIRGTHYYCG